MLLLNDKPIDSFIFSGGEIQLKISDEIKSERVILTWKPTNASEIVSLQLAVSALKCKGIHDIDLDILYLPYARQDRVCSPGEANSLEVICKLLSVLDVNVIRLWDVHNKDKTFDLLDDHCLVHLNAYDIFHRFKIFDMINSPDIVLCAPDQGAEGRVMDISNQFNVFTPIYMSKIRCPESGKITSMKADKYNRCVEGWDILIIDDICDGGGTFLQAAQILREKGAANLYLYVTHGIFSKGLDLLEAQFKHIFCHHVLHDDKFKSTDKLTILREFPHVS